MIQFSARIFKTLHSSVFPIIESRYGSRVQFILRQQIQPWHPSSTLVHEAAAIVLRLTPAKFYDFSAALFEKQEEYFDISVRDETRNQTYKRLAKLAADTVGVAEHEVYKSLEITGPGEDGSLNNGNKATDDIKLMVKARKLSDQKYMEEDWLTYYFKGKSNDRYTRYANCSIQC